MRTRILNQATLAVIAVSVILALGACQGTGKTNGTAGTGGEMDAPAKGTRYLGGKLELDSIDVPAVAGQPVTFDLMNVSGEDLDDVTATLILYTPSTHTMADYDTQKIEETFKIFRNDHFTMSVVPAGGAPVEKVGLIVDSGVTSAQPTLKREGGYPGSGFLGGLLECVDVDDRTTFENPSITFTVENVSKETIEMLEYQVVLLKYGSVIAETPWEFVEQTVAPGRSVALRADLSGIDVGAATSILRIRRPRF